MFMISDENLDAVYYKISYNTRSIDIEIQEIFWSAAYVNLTD